MKPSLKVIVRGTKVTAELTDVLTSGMVGVPVEFQFDEDWGDLRKLGVFEGSGQKKYLDLNLGGELTIPWEVLTEERTLVKVGVEWREADGTVVIPTRWAEVGVVLPGAQAGNDPALEPTPTVYDQIMQAIESGRLKGEDGLTPYIGGNGNWWLGKEDTGIKAEGKDGYTPVKGKDYFDGAPGYTPQRGVDYWTPDDQQAINAHIAEEVAALGDHSTIVCEAKGENILVTDSAKAKLRGLVMYGKFTQDGTPTPESPVEIVSAGADGTINTTVAGKNLLPNTAQSKTQSGITFTVNADGSVTANGTATANIFFQIGQLNLAVGTLYRLTGGAKGGSGNTYRLYYKYNDGKYADDFGDGVTFTAVDGFTTQDVVIGITSGATLTNIVFYPMVRIASAGDDAYEPYKGQTLTALTPNGLLGIKVASGGNWTDSTGQQWISNVKDFGRGENEERLTTLTIDYVNQTDSTGKLFGIIKNTLLFDGTSGNEIQCDQYSYASLQAARKADYAITMYGYTIWIRNKDYATIEEFNTALAANPIKVLAPLGTPVIMPLSEEELAQYRELYTNYPTTTILNDEGVGMKVSYVADTKNYIDKKINELRLAIVANV